MTQSTDCESRGLNFSYNVSEQQFQAELHDAGVLRSVDQQLPEIGIIHVGERGRAVTWYCVEVHSVEGIKHFGPKLQAELFARDWEDPAEHQVRARESGAAYDSATGGSSRAERRRRECRLIEITVVNLLVIG